MADYLPGLLGEIAEIAGEAAALRIARAKGGRRAYFPARPKPGSWIVEAVGQEAAARICSALVAGERGVELPVPLGPVGTRGRVWHILQRAFADGATVAEAAALAGVDERTARRHKNRQSGARRDRSRDDRQESLF